MKILLVESTKNITKINTIRGKTLLVAVLSLMLWSCSAPLKVTEKRHKNLSYLYNQEEAFLHPEYQVYNGSKDSSMVYLRLPMSDLLFKEVGGGKKYGYIKLKYVLYQSLSRGGIIDSASMVHRIIYDDSPSKVLKFKIKAPFLTQSYLKVNIEDMISERKRSDYITIYKTGTFNRQSILIKDRETNMPVFGNELLVGRNYEFDMMLSQQGELQIQEQNLDESIALVPYSKQRRAFKPVKPDTSYFADSNILKIKEKKNLFLTLNPTQSKGVLFLAVDSSFNYLHNPTQMLKPLGYLLSNNEYKKLLASKNRKIALDQFWLKTAGNVRLAKQMIQVYYHRTSVANKYFTSYKQGWQTDRGMIYMIYGEPATIYKSETLERWIYGTLDSDVSLSFDFQKQNNLVNDNDYILDRVDYYQTSWTQAVDAWRNGRIYSVAK